jgi:hypothetical protein
MAALLTGVVIGSAAADPGAAAFITASPNPVPRGPDAGRTTIAWSTGSDRRGRVMLSINDEREILFAINPADRLEAPWIADGVRYEFRLYDDRSNARLASVTVTRGWVARSPFTMIAAAVVVGLLLAGELVSAAVVGAWKALRH